MPTLSSFPGRRGAAEHLGFEGIRCRDRAPAERWSAADGILETFDHISPAAIYDAISYYYDHTDEIEGYLANNTWQAVLDRHKARVVEGRVVFDDHLLERLRIGI